MLKIIAALSVAAAFFLGGRYIAFLESEKAALITDVISMISSVENRLRYSCPPLSDVLRALVDSGCGRLSPFVNSCAQAVACGIPFPTAWKESLLNERELCRLLDGEENSLIKLGEALGTTDIEGQLSCCEYYKSIFETELSERREKSVRYSKLFPPLGMLLGISAAIFMI